MKEECCKVQTEINVHFKPLGVKIFFLKTGMLSPSAPTLKMSLWLWEQGQEGVEQREVDWLCNLAALRMSTDPYIHSVSWTPWEQQWTTQAAGDESAWTSLRLQKHSHIDKHQKMKSCICIKTACVIGYIQYKLMENVFMGKMYFKWYEVMLIIFLVH